jgi:sarcosine oxidase subunit beta
MPTYDALVIGAGYIGCSVAYHLTKAGLRTALLDRGGIGAGASRANYGNIQVQDAELEHSLPMIRAGYACFETLEEELGRPVGLRKLGGLLLIETESQWRMMAARLPQLHAAGIRAEMVAADQLPELEPLLDPTTVLGACYHEHEGQVNPFALMSAYVNKARSLGLTLYLDAEITDFATRSGRIQGVRTSQDDFSASTVILCTGAWTPAIGRMLGRTWDIPHVHGQALVTEAAPHLRLKNHIASAAFFEDVHGEDDAVSAESAVLAISQTAEGHFLLGEAAKTTAELGSTATPTGQAAIAHLSARHFPALRDLRVLRGWAAPVAFTNDGLPFLGSVDGLDGLILATAFKSTVIVTPLVGRIVTDLVVNNYTNTVITPFSPDR